MPNPGRFNPRNKAVGETNMLLILASLKAGPKTMVELMAITGLTRQTVYKKIKSSADIGITDDRPQRYYLGDNVPLATIPDEVVTKSDKIKATEAKVAAIVNSGSNIVFFPKASHHDHSKFHDFMLNADTVSADPLFLLYQGIKSKNDIDSALHSIKTMYDMLEFRKTLKEFE